MARRGLSRNRLPCQTDPTPLPPSVDGPRFQGAGEDMACSEVGGRAREGQSPGRDVSGWEQERPPTSSRSQ